jgi:hypothetical protein
MSHSTRLVLFIILGILLFSTGGILWYRHKGMNGRKYEDTEHKLPAIKIILTNGCGFEGIAKEFADFLADKNVDVVSMGNSLRPVYNKTIIVNHKGDAEDLQRLQRMTGISRYTEVRNENALAEFEIIVGKDYELYTKK